MFFLKFVMFLKLICLFLKILYDLGRVHFYQQNYEKADTSFAACKNLMSKVRLLVIQYYLWLQVHCEPRKNETLEEIVYESMTDFSLNLTALLHYFVKFEGNVTTKFLILSSQLIYIKWNLTVLRSHCSSCLEQFAAWHYCIAITAHLQLMTTLQLLFTMPDY